MLFQPENSGKIIKKKTSMKMVLEDVIPISITRFFFKLYCFSVHHLLLMTVCVYQKRLLHQRLPYYRNNAIKFSLFCFPIARCIIILPMHKRRISLCSGSVMASSKAAADLHTSNSPLLPHSSWAQNLNQRPGSKKAKKG